MSDDEMILWLAVGAVVLFWLASGKKTTGGPGGGHAPGWTPFGPGGTGGPYYTPPSTGPGSGQPACMDANGNIVPMNADGSCPAGSTLTIAVDVTSPLESM